MYKHQITLFSGNDRLGHNIIIYIVRFALFVKYNTSIGPFHTRFRPFRQLARRRAFHNGLVENCLRARLNNNDNRFEIENK